MFFVINIDFDNCKTLGRKLNKKSLTVETNVFHNPNFFSIFSANKNFVRTSSLFSITFAA